MPRDTHRSWWWINWLSVVLGVTALIWMVHSLGAHTILRTVRAAGGPLAACLALDIVATFVRARVLHVLLRPAQRMVAYPRVVVAQAAGAALGDLTPTGVLGEATRASMLLGHAPAPAVLSAIVGYDVLALYVPAAVLTIGAFVIATSDGLPSALEHAIVASAIVLVAAAAAASWLLRRGLGRTLLAFPARLGLLSAERHARWLERLETLDAQLRDLHTHARSERAAGFALLLLARAIAWIEMYICLRVVGVHPDAGLFAAIVLGQMAIGRLSSIIPLGLGLSDAGSAALFALFGFSPATGVTYSLLRRLRQLASALLGLSAMAITQVSDRIRLALAESRVRRRHAQAPLSRA